MEEATRVDAVPPARVVSLREVCFSRRPSLIVDSWHVRENIEKIVSKMGNLILYIKNKLTITN